MRPIDADALKNEIHEKDPFGGMNYEWYIDHAPTINLWHSIEEEPPEIGQVVLIDSKFGRYFIVKLDETYRWQIQGGGWLDYPYAISWMPIPGSPKENR